MAKATLEYNLSEHDDEVEFTQAIHGRNSALVLHNLNEWLREQIKHQGKEELSPVRDKLLSLMEEYGIDLDILLP